MVESLLKTDSTMLWSSVIAEEWNKFAMGKGHLPRRKEINMKADLQHLINMECLSLYLINRLNRDYFNCSPVQALFANNIKNDWFSNEKHQISFWFAVNLIGPGSSVQVSKPWKWQHYKWYQTLRIKVQNCKLQVSKSRLSQTFAFYIFVSKIKNYPF